MKETCEVCKKEKDTKNIIHYCNYPVPGGTIKFNICENCDRIIEKWDEMITEKWEKLQKKEEKAKKIYDIEQCKIWHDKAEKKEECERCPIKACEYAKKEAE